MKILRIIKNLFVAIISFLLVVFISLIITLKLNYVIPIFMYHGIDKVAHENSKLLVVDPDILEKQMNFLQKNKYNVVYIYEIAEMIKDKKKIPSKTVAITFDDGYRNNFTNAFPILRKHNIPATFFVIVDYIDNPDYLNAEQIKLLSDSGIDIGCHTQSHLWLNGTCDEDRWRKEIIASKKKLEEIVGKKVKSFSYPGGDGVCNDKIRKIVKEAGYEVAVATNPGKNFPDREIYGLKRLRITNRDVNMFSFWFKLTGCYTYLKEFKAKKKK